MITTLVFFDETANSKLGTLRGVVAFPIVILFGFLWYFLLLPKIDKNSKIVKSISNIIILVIASIILVSAIGVQLPTNSRNAGVYGSLVGFCIFGICNIMMIANGNRSICTGLIDTVFGMILTTLCSFVVFKACIY